MPTDLQSEMSKLLPGKRMDGEAQGAWVTCDIRIASTSSAAYHESDLRRVRPDVAKAKAVIPMSRPAPVRLTNARRTIGFTLVEMLVVCSVIIALLGIGFPVLYQARKNAMKSGTVALVEGVAAAISTYTTRSWTWNDGGSTKTALLWDLNGDGELDGNPAAGDGQSAAIVASGYTGVLDMAQPEIGEQYVTPQRQIADAWGQVLRISYPEVTNGMTDAQVQAELLRYGSDGFSVWSIGEDGQPGTADDIHHGAQINAD